MGIDVEPLPPEAPPSAGPVAWRLRLLGAMALLQGGAPVPLPRSRKVRALLAYLALAPRAVSRQHLCELLWDTPADPRGELRWCLSKLRGLLADGAGRIAADGDAIRFEPGALAVDVAELDAAVRQGLATLPGPALQRLLDLFEGDFLEGLDLPGSPTGEAWLAGQRRRLRALHAVVLEHLSAAHAPASGEAAALLGRWVQLAPFDRRAHERLLAAMASRGERHEGDAHLRATIALFETEGLDPGPLVHAWQAAKERAAAAAPEPDAPHAPPTDGAATALPALQRATPSPVPPIGDAADAAPHPATHPATQRASIAVMPFEEAGHDPAARATAGAGLAYDLTMRLAKLRTLFVIAPGSTAALMARGMGAGQSAHVLAVDYVVSGVLRRRGEMLRAEVQLTEARTARVCWADVVQAPASDTLAVLDEIGGHLVGAIAGQVELAERNRAILKPPEGLDAWEAHHCGLWHMYRFEDRSNAQAQQFFEQAIRLDPTFSRPYAGLSFTHFQNAFLGWADRARQVELAYRVAAQGALADDQDPAVRWALGRASWLRGDIDVALAELRTSVDLSPNFAQGHYAIAFVQSQSGDPDAAIRASDVARELSPFDPMLFAMLGARAMALMRLGRHDEAADWAVRAAARPNAHVHIMGIAAHCLALAGRHDQARRLAAAIRARVPGYDVEAFLGAFRFSDDAVALARRAARSIGLE